MLEPWFLIEIEAAGEIEEIVGLFGFFYKRQYWMVGRWACSWRWNETEGLRSMFLQWGVKRKTIDDDDDNDYDGKRWQGYGLCVGVLG